MRRRRSTRSVIKLLAAAAVTTASSVSLVRPSTPPAKLPLALCEDIEEIDTKVLAHTESELKAAEKKVSKMFDALGRRPNFSGRSSTGSFCPRCPYGPRALESPDPTGGIS